MFNVLIFHHFLSLPTHCLSFPFATSIFYFKVVLSIIVMLSLSFSLWLCRNHSSAELVLLSVIEVLILLNSKDIWFSAAIRSFLFFDEVIFNQYFSLFLWNLHFYHFIFIFIIILFFSFFILTSIEYLIALNIFSIELIELSSRCFIW